MALKQQLQLKQQQKLSPLQMQVIKLTELPYLELEDRIRQELEDNPALEEGFDENNPNADDETLFDSDADSITQDDIALGDYLNEEDIPDYRLAANNRSYEDHREEIPFAVAESLNESLLAQLHLCNLNEEEQIIAEYIIGSIDESGYLERELSAISDDLLFQQNIDATPQKRNHVLHIIQQLEPAGIAARNLQECLLLQMERLPQNEINTLAKKILTDYFDEFSKRHFEKIQKTLSINESTLKEIIHEITSLNPKPGNAWDSSFALGNNAIVPDFIIEVHNGEVILSMNNRNIPELRVSRQYANMLQGYSGNKKSMTADAKNAVLFVKQKLDSAKWFIEAIRQRQETLQRTMQAIIELQYDFFVTGDETRLRPMILKDVAELSGYDISTVSRVSNSKYVQTYFGVYPLKYFFSESMQNDVGEEVSSREIKAILKDCVEHENKKKPLTDDKLSELLKEKGYLIARRTVAKYREQLGIPVARLRKEI
ncbi:RNA polymerase sigma-54 factor [Dysgonomonas sp. PH5-45]|uniref:RNA polymerase factor sigma-54 n=1 Tax=unclassified Dysgonomonas TaxID=2630389 RepID=UPI002476A0CB|nr:MULTISPECIES: RNA polymerase factor sigma-54 [unclassified Dysgonomonas]MDH6355526.1 RNA polymerase sigma-54 factor [Dysgonomonas sp. PH5-45]MDH6388413.1 RNA polymerase sigma-54 factor [Dysgonomonas sp. PH5-37]